MARTRTPLTPARISGAALALIDDHGLEALSMRKLGDALGFEAMAIYKHVADKEALLDLVVTDIYETMEPADEDRAWDDRLRHIAGELREAALAHPHMFVRMVTRPPGSLAVTTRINDILTALRDAGLSETKVVEVFWIYVNTTAGALLAETSALTGATPIQELDGIDEVECAALVKFGPALANCDFKAIHDQSLNALIETIRQR